MSRRTARVGKLVNGKVPMSRPERYLAAGASTAATVAALAKSVGTIMSMINSEKKFLDFNENGISTDFNGWVRRITSIPQGDGDSARNGNTVLGSDVVIRGKVSYVGTSISAIANSIRIMLVVDKEDPRGVAPTVADILQVVGDASAPLSPLNQANTKRYVIVKTKLFAIDFERRSMSFKIYAKLPFHVYFTGTDNTIASADQNQVYLMAVSDVGVAPIPLTNISMRFHYYDN